VVLVLVLAALLGGAAGLAAMKFGVDGAGTAGGSGERGTAGPAPTPSSSVRSADPAAEEVTPDEIPDGWKRVADPEGFSLLVPEGWERRTDSGQIDYTPDGGAHRIRISLDPQPDFDDSLAHMRSIEKDLAARLPGYERLTLESNVFRDRPGSRWEFTWVESKDHPGPRHGIDQMYFAERGGPEYALYMTGPDEDREETRKLFETMLRSWQPPESAG
jgi:hypothetical protein